MITVLYIWTIPSRTIAFALLRMGLDRTLLRKSPGVVFAKTLGIGSGVRFTPGDADLHRWGFILSISEELFPAFDQSALVNRWRKRSLSEFRILLDPIASRGQWSKREPFEINPTISASGKIVAITRARIAWRENIKFWRALPPVTQALHSSPGLIYAIGIGEAPLGLQGTFSLWESAEALRDFAYKSPAHRQVIAETQRRNWYSEELFARFSVREIHGEL